MKKKRFCNFVAIMSVFLSTCTNTVMASNPNGIPPSQVKDQFTDRSEPSVSSDRNENTEEEALMDIDLTMRELQAELEPIIDDFDADQFEVERRFELFERAPYTERTILSKILMCTSLLKNERIGTSESTAFALTYMLTNRHVMNKILLVDLKDDLGQRYVICYDDGGQCINGIRAKHGLRIIDFVSSSETMGDLMYSLKRSPTSKEMNDALKQLKANFLCTPIEAYLESNKENVENISIIYLPEDTLGCNVNCIKTVSITEREELGGWPGVCELCQKIGITLED